MLFLDPLVFNEGQGVVLRLKFGERQNFGKPASDAKWINVFPG